MTNQELYSLMGSVAWETLPVPNPSITLLDQQQLLGLWTGFPAAAAPTLGLKRYTVTVQDWNAVSLSVADWNAVSVSVTDWNRVWLEVSDG